MIIIITLINNVKQIYTAGKDNEIIEEGYILINNNKIKEIGQKENLDSETKKSVDQIIDASEKIALPGFINTHTHAAMTLLRGYADDLPLQTWLEDKIWPFESKLRQDDIYWGTLFAIIEMIKSGTTTFTDMYFQMDQAAKAVKESGIRAVLSEGLIEDNDGIEGLNQSVDFAVNYNGQAEKRITTMLAPHSPYTCSVDYLQRVIEKSDEYNLPINIHLAETKTEVDIISDRNNTTPVRFLNNIGLLDRPTLAAHCVHVDSNEIDILAEKNIGIAYNPLSNMKLGSGIAPINKMLKKNMNVGFGTDGAASNNNLDLIEDAKIGSYLQKVNNLDASLLNTDKLLKMLTINGAKALQLRQLGCLEEGYKADLNLIDINKSTRFYPHHNNLSNFFYSALSDCIDTVIINGKIIMKDRELLTIDESIVRKEIEKRAAELA